MAGPVYFKLAGMLLLAAALLSVLRPGGAVIPRARCRSCQPRSGGAVGFLSGLSGIGGGVFLAPALLALGWASARETAAISPPFILCNSAFALAGTLLGGQALADGAALYTAFALAGAIVGTSISLRFMSERATRAVLFLILLFAGMRLLTR